MSDASFCLPPQRAYSCYPNDGYDNSWNSNRKPPIWENRWLIPAITNNLCSLRLSAVVVLFQGSSVSDGMCHAFVFPSLDAVLLRNISIESYSVPSFFLCLLVWLNVGLYLLIDHLCPCLCCSRLLWTGRKSAPSSLIARPSSSKLWVSAEFGSSYYMQCVSFCTEMRKYVCALHHLGCEDWLVDLAGHWVLLPISATFSTVARRGVI